MINVISITRTSTNKEIFLQMEITQNQYRYVNNTFENRNFDRNLNNQRNSGDLREQNSQDNKNNLN